jgi:hypothetical protein
MSTIGEIEIAIENLPAPQLEELAMVVWDIVLDRG